MAKDMMLDLDKTRLMNIGEIFDKLDEENVNKITDVINLFRSLEQNDRLTLLMFVINKSTETHTEEMSLATSIIVNKIIGHYKGDRKVLKALLEGIMQGVVHVEDKAGVSNGVKK